jgi:hypothetical protein
LTPEVCEAILRHLPLPPNPDPRLGLPDLAVHRISGIGDKSNARRAVRALLARGFVQRTHDSERLRLTPAPFALELWRLAPSCLDPQLDDAKAKAVLKTFGEGGNETYEEWFREAADEVEDALGTEGETAIPPWEVRERVRRRVLLHLAEGTTGEVSDAMRSVARECGKRGD